MIGNTSVRICATAGSRRHAAVLDGELDALAIGEAAFGVGDGLYLGVGHGGPPRVVGRRLPTERRVTGPEGSHDEARSTNVRSPRVLAEPSAFSWHPSP